MVFIFQCILGLQSQSIELTNGFAQVYITSGETFFIELPRDFNSDVGKYDVVLRLKKILYGQAKAARLWYEKFAKRFVRYCHFGGQGESLYVHV